MRTWYYADPPAMNNLITDLAEDSNFLWGLAEGETDADAAARFDPPLTLFDVEDEETNETIDTCEQEDPGNARLLTEEATDDECGDAEVIDTECSNTDAGQCIDSSIVRVNWDGQEIQAGRWYDKKLFSVWGLEIDVKEAIAISGGLLVLIIIIATLCCYCSWRKREAIGEGARRLSTVVSRGASQIRRSIVGR